MCLILFAHAPAGDPAVVVAANRDEFFERPTAVAQRWRDDPRIVGGRDLRSGGTWLGVTRDGRFAAVTNHREPGVVGPGERSRGELVTEFLTSDLTPNDYLDGVQARGGAYAGFGLLVGRPGEMAYLSNRGAGPRAVDPGVHGLSNHLLDTPWPKVRLGRQRLQRLLARTPGERPTTAELLGLLDDRGRADDRELPDTGVGLERERALSPSFVMLGDYGTRCSTAIVVGADGRIEFHERSFDGEGRRSGDVSMDWTIGVGQRA